MNIDPSDLREHARNFEEAAEACDRENEPLYRIGSAVCLLLAYGLRYAADQEASTISTSNERKVS